MVENALDGQLCRRLVREFPPLETFTQGRPYGSNEKIYYVGVDALQNPDLSRAWKDLVGNHLQRSIWAELLTIFRPHLLGAYPDFEERFGKLDDLKIGTRHIDEYSNCDVLLDSELVIHAPVTGDPCVERGPHLKMRDKIFVAYLYLRPDEDKSQDPDHALYSIKPGESPVFDSVQVADPALLNLEKLIPCRHNTLIVFLNTPQSIQGLTARSAGTLPLMMYHFLAEMPETLFEIEFERPQVRWRLLRALARQTGLRTMIRGGQKLLGHSK